MLIRAYKGTLPRIGERVFLAENVSIIGDVEIGDDSSVWYGTVVRGDVHYIKIGQRTNIQDNCVVHVTNGVWPTIVGNDVSIGHGVIVHGCTIDRGCLIGMGSVLLDGCTIGEEALVGAGAVVPEGMEVPPRSLVLGVPGKVRRELTESELDRVRKNSRYYLEYKETYLSEGNLESS